MRWEEEVAAALAAAGYRQRLSFRGRRGFAAEVGNGLGRPAVSALSAACPLRFFLFPAAFCACATLCSPQVAPRWSFGFGLLRLSSGISVCGGDYSAVQRVLPGMRTQQSRKRYLQPFLIEAGSGCLAVGGSI